MAKLLKLRRGTTSQHGSFTGAEGEVTVDTDKETLVVHDGSTAGGHAVAAEDMANVSSASIVGRLGTGSIVKAKLEADIIDSTKLADDSVNSEHYVDGSIDTAHIADLQVTTAKIAADAITGAKIADDQINSEHYVDGSIDTAHIADAQVTHVKLANDCVDGDNIQDDVVNSEHIAAGAVDLEHMASESVDEDNLKISNAGSNGNFLQKQSGNAGGLTWAAVDLSSYAPLAAPALTGNATAVNLTLSGNLTVNGTTTTVATTNTTVTDNLLELNSGASSNANDSGILIERGSTGDNAIIAWDESADKFVVGTTTAANNATGDLTITTGTLVANVEGNVTGTATTATNITVADESSDTTCFPLFSTAATGDLAPKSGSNLTFNSATGILTAGGVTADVTGNVTGNCSGTSGGFTAGSASNLNSGTVATARLGSGTANSGTFLAGDNSWQEISAAPTITATANGSISANEAVIVESDGKVAGITGYADATSTSVNGPQTDQTNYGPRYLNTAWDEGNETIFAFWYEHTGNSGQSKFYAAAGTCSGAATTSVTWGSKVEVYDGAGGWSQVVSLGSNKYLLCWSQDNNESRGQIATVSGTTVTMQGSSSEDTDLGNKYTDSDLIALSSTKAVLAYADGSSANSSLQTITISGNSISWGTSVDNAGSHRNGGFNRLAKISSSKFLWTFFRQPFQTIYGRICDVGSSDTTATVGDMATFIDNKGQNHKTIWDPVKEQGAFIFDYANNSKPAALKWTYSGTNTLSVSTGTITADLTTANAEQYNIVGDISATSNMLIAYRDHYDSGLDFFKLVQDGDTFTVSDISYDSQSGVDVMSGEASHFSCDVHLVGSNKFLIVWGTSISSAANYVRSFVRQFPATDLTPENFIGYSSAGYTNGQTATINVVGNTSTQSSLTPGQKYYLQNDGSLGLSPADPSVIGGRALTSTSLLITYA